MTSMNHDFTAQRRNLAHDVHRPVYHFVAPSSRMNDPNGVIHWGDEYHLYSIHAP